MDFLGGGVPRPAEQELRGPQALVAHLADDARPCGAQGAHDAAQHVAAGARPGPRAAGHAGEATACR